VTELTDAIVREKPDLVGLNCSTHTFLAAAEVLKDVAARLPDATIVLGGYHATLAMEKILRSYPFIDYIIGGEGEFSFVKLLDYLDRGARPAGVPGISFLERDEFVSSEPELIEDLDALPSPDRTLLQGIDYGYVFQGIPPTFGKFTTMCTSQGCAYDCTYCSCAAFSRRRWRYRSAENVVDELERPYKEGYENVVLIDDNFTQRRDRVEKICDLIRARGIRLKLYCESRVNHSSVGLFQTMKSTGFEVIYFGVESASEHVLDYYRKRVTPAQAKQAVASAKQCGLIVITSPIIGAPVESVDDMRRTIGFIRELRPHGMRLNMLDVLVGTEIWQAMPRDGWTQPDDWKTNHRIYEYNRSGPGNVELETLAVEGYNAFLASWKTPSGVAELARLALRNSVVREIITHNILNMRAMAAIARGIDAPYNKPG
jgi:anaerobic magnesium-protoporphyrin IX monomethyl ester cyclase